MDMKWLRRLVMGKSLDLRLKNALSRRDSQAAADALKAGADPEVDHWGETGMRLATRNGDLELARVMLRAGAKVSDIKGGDSLVWLAAKGGHAGILGALLDAGADPNGGADHFTSALFEACRIKSVECVKILASKGADSGPRADRDGCVYEACARGNAEIAMALLECGVSPDRGMLGRNCGHAMAKSEHLSVEVAKALMDSGVDFEEPDEEGSSAVDFLHDWVDAAREFSLGMQSSRVYNLWMMDVDVPDRDPVEGERIVGAIVAEIEARKIRSGMEPGGREESAKRVGNPARL